jgi:fructose transport system ATP-binding protein
VDQEGEGVNEEGPILEARGLVKRYGRVLALGGADFELRPAEVLAVVGDNGAGKSTLIKCLSGAIVPDEGEVLVDGERVHLRNPLDARALGIETVYQNLAVSPALDIATNLYLGRERRKPGLQGKVLRRLDKRAMREEAARQMDELGILTIQNIAQQVETLSGGQRQGVAVARAAAFGSRVLIMDEPTAALGVRESAKVLELIARVRDSGLPVILISHNMPHVFEVADRIHVQRLGNRAAVVSPKTHTMNEVVAIMTGATSPEAAGYEQVVHEAERHDAARTADGVQHADG